jgi:hypothetical protein
MSERCLVCRGERKIRLPLYRPVTLRFDPEAAIAVDESYREYPCPECAPTVPPERIRVLEANFQADTRYEGEPGYRKHLIRTGVNAIARLIEDGGFIRFQEGKPDRVELKRGYRMTVGVVAPKVTAGIDAQNVQKQDAFAQDFLTIAADKIENWGSHYGHSEFLMQDEKRLLDAALSIAKRRRPQ